MTDEDYIRFSVMVRPWLNKHFTQEDFRHACVIYIQDECTTDKEFRTICNRLTQRNKRKHYREIGYNEKKKQYKGTSFQNSRTVFHLDKEFSNHLLNQDTFKTWQQEERDSLLKEEHEMELLEDEMRYHGGRRYE